MVNFGIQICKLNIKRHWIVFGLIGVLLLINNWSLPFWDQDESAYAGFGKTMNETGNYLIPDYYFSDDHRKTPLHFWNVAFSFKIFGANEFGVRFPSVLAIFGTLLLVFYQCRKLFSETVALNSVVAIGTSFLVTSLAKISVTDATVLFFSTLSGFAILRVLLEPEKKWIFLFWLGFGLGVLTKGPPIIIFTGAFAGLVFLFHPDRFNLLKLRPWFFLPLAIAPVAYWCYLVSIENDQFLYWLYDWYVLRRISGSVYGQSAPFGTHFLLLFGFYLLSAMYFFQSFYNGIKGFWNKNYMHMILGAWLVGGWFLYELTPSKLPAYIIPAHIPMGILIGLFVDQFSKSGERPHIIFSGLHYLLNISFGVGLIIANQFIPINDDLSWALKVIGVLYILFIVWQFIIYKKPFYFATQQLGNLTLLIGIWTIAPLFSAHVDSSKKVSEYVLDNIDQDDLIYVSYAPGHQPSLPFYLTQEDNPIKVNLDTHELIEAAKSNLADVYIVSEPQYLELQKLGIKYRVKTITSRLIDRREQALYYICLPE